MAASPWEPVTFPAVRLRAITQKRQRLCKSQLRPHITISAAAAKAGNPTVPFSRKLQWLAQDHVKVIENSDKLDVIDTEAAIHVMPAYTVLCICMAGSRSLAIRSLGLTLSTANCRIKRLGRRLSVPPLCLQSSRLGPIPAIWMPSAAG